MRSRSDRIPEPVGREPVVSPVITPQAVGCTTTTRVRIGTSSVSENAGPSPSRAGSAGAAAPPPRERGSPGPRSRPAACPDPLAVVRNSVVPAEEKISFWLVVVIPPDASMKLAPSASSSSTAANDVPGRSTIANVSCCPGALVKVTVWNGAPESSSETVLASRARSGGSNSSTSRSPTCIHPWCSCSAAGRECIIIGVSRGRRAA